MLDEGLVHILATDAHNMGPRPPDLLEGRLQAEKLAGAAEAEHLTVTRPRAVLLNERPNALPPPRAKQADNDLGVVQTTGRASCGRPD